MSNKDISKNANNSPEQLEDKDLDQVDGGYTEVEWTRAKSTTERKITKTAETKEIDGFLHSGGDPKV